MKENKFSGKNMKKSILATTMIIGASTLMFQGFTCVASASEYNKSVAIPTSYAVTSTKTTVSNLPSGYKKANYTVKAIDLDYYRHQSPTNKDMSKESAAEIGAQALWNIYGLNLNNQVIEMGYQPATDSLPRSNWYADVYINGKLSYYFSVDSVTGELFSVGYNRTLNKSVSIGYDAALAKNPQKYAALAKKTAEKFNVVHSPIISVNYNCQGYGNNDPDITFDIKGKNGEVASMTFSRYDMALLGIGFNAEYKYTLAQNEKIDQEMQAKEKNHKQTNPSSHQNQTPSLTVLQ